MEKATKTSSDFLDFQTLRLSITEPPSAFPMCIFLQSHQSFPALLSFYAAAIGT